MGNTSKAMGVLLKLAVSFFAPLKKLFPGKVYIQEVPLNILKPLICFESETNLN